MLEARTTIAVVPRDKFAHAVPSLSSILGATPAPRRLVYVDGGSPTPVRDAPARLAVEHDFTLLRTDHYLAPNEARNLALGHIDTEFALFVDNDVFVTDGWLPKLEAAADAHNAVAVAPAYGIASGTLDAPRVHHAGGNCHLVEVDGTRVLDTTRFVVENADPDVVLCAGATAGPRRAFAALRRHGTSIVTRSAPTGSCAAAPRTGRSASGPTDQ